MPQAKFPRTTYACMATVYLCSEMICISAAMAIDGKALKLCCIFSPFYS